MHICRSPKHASLVDFVGAQTVRLLAGWQAIFPSRVDIKSARLSLGRVVANYSGCAAPAIDAKCHNPTRSALGRLNESAVGRQVNAGSRWCILQAARQHRIGVEHLQNPSLPLFAEPRY